jgi:hypothetical protein
MKQFWKDSDPLSDRMIIGHGVGPAFADEPLRQIIGVVGDVRDGALNRDPGRIMYVSSAQITDGENALAAQMVPWAWVIRTRVTPMSLSSAIQNELREASGGLPVARARTMAETMSPSTAADDFNTLVLTIFGCSALALAAIGIYGLMATPWPSARRKSASGWEQIRPMCATWSCFKALRIGIKPRNSKGPLRGATFRRWTRRHRQSRHRIDP